jgi:hypothetical protein
LIVATFLFGPSRSEASWRLFCVRAVPNNRSIRLSKKKPKAAADLTPHSIVRFVDGPAHFGYQIEQLRNKIKRGEIPTPIPLSATGRAVGWTGQQIMDHHAAMLKLAERRR